MNKLRECPHCGSEAILQVIEPHKHDATSLANFMEDYEGGAFVECTGCTASMAETTAEGVIAAWNTRACDAQITALQAENAALREENVGYKDALERGEMVRVPGLLSMQACGEVIHWLESLAEDEDIGRDEREEIAYLEGIYRKKYGEMYHRAEAEAALEKEHSPIDPCEGCMHSPPSSFDGKPCCACDPDDPKWNCYVTLEKEE